MKKLLHLLILSGMISSAGFLQADSCCATNQAADKAQLADEDDSYDDEEDTGADVEEESGVAAEAAVSSTEQN